MERFWTLCARRRIAIIGGTLAFAFLFPLIFSSSYIQRIGIICLMYTMLALSLNLIVGFMGQMSMGHAAFWGIGAYTAALLSKHFGLSSVGTFLASMAVAGLFSLFLGLPVLKLKGYYLTIVTLGFCEIIRLVELNWMSLTNGSLGISNIAPLRFFGVTLKGSRNIYYVALALLIFTVFVIHSLVSSQVGLAIMAIRDDEVAASSVGINVFRFKVLTFVIAGMLAGLAGAFYAHYISYVDPSGFTTGQSMEFVTLAIFGGLGSIPGSILGAVALTILPETLRSLSEYRGLIYGIIIVVMMLVKPEGIMGNVNFKYIVQRLNMGKESGEEKGKA